MEHTYTAAVIVAAGGSTRMGEPKQRIDLAGIPVIFRTLLAFEAAQTIGEVVVVTREEDIPYILDGAAARQIRKLGRVVPGGATRQQSVAAGVAAVSPRAAFFAIHDGARPLVRPQTIDRVVGIAYETGAAAAAVRVKDTIKQADQNGVVTGTPDRETLWSVQTPQVFSAELYRRAMERAARDRQDFTDDCQLMEYLGHPVQLVPGEYSNLKITTPDDVAFAQAILQKTEFRGG